MSNNHCHSVTTLLQFIITIIHVPIILKSGSLNLLELLGRVQACNGIALPLHSIEASVKWQNIYFKRHYNLIAQAPVTIHLHPKQLRVNHCRSQVCRNIFIAAGSLWWLNFMLPQRPTHAHYVEVTHHRTHAHAHKNQDFMNMSTGRWHNPRKQ